MKTIFTALAFSAALLAIGCADDSVVTGEAPATRETPLAQAELTPEELGELGARIEKNPNEARKLLSEKGLNEESFEQAVRRISEDPAASRRYAEAYRRASA